MKIGAGYTCKNKENGELVVRSSHDSIIAEIVYKRTNE